MILNAFISIGALGFGLVGWLGVTSCRVLGIRGCSGNFECRIMVVWCCGCGKHFNGFVAHWGSSSSYGILSGVKLGVYM